MNRVSAIVRAIFAFRVPKRKRALYMLLVIPVLLATGCKTIRKAPSSKASDKIGVIFDAGVETAPPSKTPAPPGAAVSATASSGYPAREYYGDRWNAEHVRINSDPQPSGSFTLSLIPAGTSGFAMPFCGNILSEFGPRSGRMHTGIDIKLKKEDPVYCAFDGMVRMAKDYGSYGRVVVVRHENGLETLYSHLNSIAVKLNQRVKAGDRIGGGGKTGNAQGEHLHFETRFKGEPFNPRLMVDFERCRLKSESLTLNDDSYRQYYKNMQATEVKPAPKQEQTARRKVEHIVKKGDTLYNISRHYGTTVDALRKLNNLPESAIIEIGQTLIVGF